MRRGSRWVLIALLAGPTGAALLAQRVMTPVQAQDSGVRLGPQHIRVEIDDERSLAVTTIRQELHNPSRQEASAQVSLPLADDAAMLNLEVLAPLPRKGEKREDLGSVSHVGRSAYQVDVVRVPAKGRAVFELTYAQTLPRRGSRRKYVYPVPDPSSPSLPASLSAAVRIRAPGGPQQVTCSTHTAALSRPSPSVAELTRTSNEPPDGRDLVIDYTVPAETGPARGVLSVLTSPDRSQDPYFLLSLPAPASLLRKGLRDTPTDVVLCMDISGSTRGRKLNAIQEAVHDGLTDLRPGDRFGLIAFDDDARTFRRNLVAATPDSVARAVRFVNRARPAAGSDPSRALESALAILARAPASEGRRRIVAMLIDSDDPANLAEAAAKLRQERRGVRLVLMGALPDARLLQYRMGRNRLIAGPAVALSRAALTYGPVFSGATLEASGLNSSYVYPAPEKPSSLPLSSPVLLFGRLNELPAGGDVVITGTIEGERRSLRVPWVTRTLASNSPVRGLWAARRIRRLRSLTDTAENGVNELVEAIEREREVNRLAVAPEF